MNRCVACAGDVGPDWTCPGCGFAPRSEDGILRFAPEAATAGNGFDPAAFAQLAEVEEGSFWFQGRNRLILWALKRYFPRARSLLEVGCGTGYVLSAIRRARPQMRLSAAELYVEGLMIARGRVPDADYYQLDATRIPFEREWDVVCAFDVLEHVSDDDAFLAGLFTAARPGGGLLVTVPQHPRLWGAADEYAHHVRRYRRGELLDKVRGAGFRVDRVTSFVSLLLPAMWWSRRRDRAGGEPFEPGREHSSTRLSRMLEGVLDLERNMIARGVDLPVGGSLLVVASRP